MVTPIKQHRPPLETTHQQMSLFLRHRTFYVLLLCGTSMVGCFLWWGRLPIDVSQLAQLQLTSTTTSTTTTATTTTKTTNSQSLEEDKDTPPSFLFQYTDDDDDEAAATATTRDDEHLRGESIRTGEKLQPQPQNPKKKTTFSDVQDSDQGEELTIISDATISSSNTDKTSSSTSSKITVFGVPPTETMQQVINPPKPKVVWLASYPNSGTSYTMTMVGRASQTATATNYGREVTEKHETSTPLFDDKPWGMSPFYNPNGGRPLPKDYILTKTHCGSRCVPCGPEEYLTNETEFLRECTRGAGLASLKDMDRDLSREPNFMDDGFQWVHYDPSIVKKAIHLIRSPFDNIVSRFHLERKHYVSQKKERELQRYPNNSTGFQQWCRDLNDKYGPNDDKPATDLLPNDVLKLMQKEVPCHGEFYKYVQWHNFANKVLEEKPTLVIHYEDYDTKWNRTAIKIFDFLHLERKAELKPFRFHSYDEYFSDRDRENAQKLVQQVATPAMWQLLERYF